MNDDPEVRRDEAEQKREQAELRRQQAMDGMYAKFATLVALPLAFVALIPSLIGVVVVDRQNDKLRAVISRLDREVASRCEDGRVNRDAIRQSVFEGLLTLGYRYNAATDKIEPFGQPLDYYAAHPEERQAALDRTIASLNRFPAINCD